MPRIIAYSARHITSPLVVTRPPQAPENYGLRLCLTRQWKPAQLHNVSPRLKPHAIERYPRRRTPVFCAAPRGAADTRHLSAEEQSGIFSVLQPWDGRRKNAAVRCWTDRRAAPFPSRRAKTRSCRSHRPAQNRPAREVLHLRGLSIPRHSIAKASPATLPTRLHSRWPVGQTRESPSTFQREGPMLLSPNHFHPASTLGRSIRSVYPLR